MARKEDLYDLRDKAPSKGLEVKNRHDAIKAFLRERHARGPVASSDILAHLNARADEYAYLESSRIEKMFRHVDLRTVQRDMKTLCGSGIVAKNDNGWQIAQDYSPDPEVGDLVSILAFDMFEQVLDVAVPLDMQHEVREALDILKNKLSRKSKYERWLKSLRIVPALHVFTVPQINEDIRRTVEQAILQGKKVLITVDDGGFGDWPKGEEATEKVSISHCLVKLPDRPTLVVWRDDDNGALRPYQQPTCYYVKMEHILSAELLDDNAWAQSFSPHVPALPKPNDTADIHWRTFDFRASPHLMQLWMGTWISKSMEIIGVDDEGWTICRATVPDWPPSEWGGDGDNFVEFMDQYHEDIEVLSPIQARWQFRNRLIDAVERYEDERKLPPKVKKRLMAEEHLRLAEIVRKNQAWWDSSAGKQYLRQMNKKQGL
jgi:predicted DNA-binding transcriptional regulator YafY